MQALRDTLNDYGDEVLFWFNPDARGKTLVTREWPLVKFDFALLVVVAYLMFVIVGTIVMKAKSTPLKSVKILQYIYNPVQVILCSWMSLEAGRQIFRLGGKFIDNDFQLDRTDVAEVLYIFYLSKILDFLDTIFIITNQKWKQLSFLHVYHHASIFLTYWMIVNVGYDGDIYLTIVLNGFVHTCMYLYYMITALGLYVPIKKTSSETAECVPYRPKWKFLITYLQMAQFMGMNAQAIYIWYFEAAYPIRITIYYLFYIQSLFWLFRNFAVKTYTKKKGAKKD